MASLRKKMMERWVEVAKDILDEKEGVSPAKLLDRTNEGGWLPEWEETVNVRGIRENVRRKYGKQYATVPVTEEYFATYGENPETEAEIADCLPWAHGKPTYGFVKADGSPLGIAWQKQRIKIKSAATQKQFEQLKFLADMRELNAEDMEDILHDGTGRHLGQMLQDSQASLLDIEEEDSSPLLLEDSTNPKNDDSPDPQKPR